MRKIYKQRCKNKTKDEKNSKVFIERDKGDERRWQQISRALT